MAEVIGDEGVRVRFRWTRRGEAPPWPDAAKLQLGLEALERAGLCPTLDDGLAAGNAAWREDEAIWVTPSGRPPSALQKNAKVGVNTRDWVRVDDFSATDWSARGVGPADRAPTSDTPLHWTALIDAPRRFGWSQRPNVALHGHALDHGDLAQRLGLPISERETLFSTPEDREALLALFERAPYPTHRVWVRRGHGFFLLAEDLDDALSQLGVLLARIEVL